MQEQLYKQLQDLPQQSGIYQYYDKHSRLLYVGKAKNLKKRIKSYFQADLSPNPKNSLRIQQMVRQIVAIHTLVVENEKEALILENSFIKSQNPKYNILLRDDKTYPYIMINLNEKFPRFTIVRHITSQKGIRYFGPYPKGAKEILNSLHEIFPLVQQASCLKGKRTCLYYQIEKCLGVCEFQDANIIAQYNDFVQQAISLIENKHKMQKEIEHKMLEFAQKELFEQAIVCKNCLEVLKEIQHFSIVDIKKAYNADILSFVYLRNQGILLKLFVRDGKVVSTHHIFVKANASEQTHTTTNVITNLDEKLTQNISKQDSRYTIDMNIQMLNHHESSKHTIGQEFEYEIYTQALLKILQDGSLCEEIILANITESHFAMLQDSIPEISSKLIFPKKGNKLKLAQLANLNAIHLLENNEKMHCNENKILQDIVSLFSLQQNINNIEVFDTSHHGGDFIVGAMISYNNNNFCKENYRHYNLTAKDEYGQMKEMLTRRATNFDILPAPNLWLLDGGKAQINLAYDILKSTGASVEILAIAKEKRDFKAYRAKGSAKDILRSKHLEFRLNHNDTRLQFLQKLRDEAHRFAISFHRHKKVKNISQ